MDFNLENWASEFDLEEKTVQALVDKGFKSKRTLIKLTDDLIDKQFNLLPLAQQLLLQEAVESLKSQPENTKATKGVEDTSNTDVTDHSKQPDQSKPTEKGEEAYHRYVNWSVFESLPPRSDTKEDETSHLEKEMPTGEEIPDEIWGILGRFRDEVGTEREINGVLYKLIEEGGKDDDYICRFYKRVDKIDSDPEEDDAAPPSRSEEEFVSETEQGEFTPTNAYAIGWIEHADKMLAEELLAKQNIQKGTFIVRPSDNVAGLKTLSVRTGDNKTGKVTHYRIQNKGGEYSMKWGKRFLTIPDLISYYQTCSRWNTIKGPIGCRLIVPYTECVDGMSSDGTLSIRHIEISKDSLVLEDVIGEGRFGIVYLATWKNRAGNMKVAVKQLKLETALTENVAHTTEESLQREAEIMHKLRHPRLVKIFGICTSSNRFNIVTEYIERGSLHTYLSKDKGLGNLRLLRWASEVADGMAFLEDHRFIHRDVRAENILINSDMKTQICDFGLSKLLGANKFTDDVDAFFPWKWAPIEVLAYRDYSLKSDVWSYGILLWEIFSYGKYPYSDPSFTINSSKELYDSLVNGKRLEKPEKCPQDIHGMMTSCWAEKPRDRPSFASIKSQFDDIYC